MCCLTLGIYPFGPHNRSFVSLQDDVAPNHSLYVQGVEKFLFVEEYLNRMAEGRMPKEDLVIRKSRVSRPFTADSLKQSTVPLREITLSSETKLEDYPTRVFIDFANMYAFHGCFTAYGTQEQLLCCLFPECCLARYVCSPMEDAEAISVIGCVRVGRYSGFSHTLRYAGALGS